MLFYTDQNPIAVTITLGVLTILGLVIATAALLYVFQVQKRSDIYHLKKKSSWLPLTSKQPDEAVAEESS